MQSKSLLIAIAAFAVTTTGVHAYAGTELLEKIGIDKEQIQAFEEAKELRKSGNITGARDVLLEAGIDEEVLKTVHEARHEARRAIRESIENNDYESFLEAVERSPIEDKITSESDFEKLVEAHELLREGEHEAAEEIFSELGIEKEFKHKRFEHHNHGWMSELTEEQREALHIARQSNDKETVRAIFEEAGIEFPPKKGH